MIVFDTNVVLELMRHTPDPDVVHWVDSLPVSDIFLTAVTAAELRYGVARMPEGRRSRELRTQIEGLLVEDFQDRILPFDAPAATHYADIVAARERSGRPITMADAQIAAICRNWAARLATRNIADFADTDIEVFNPWDTATW